MKKFILSLQFIFKPSYWLMNYSYSKAHDLKLNELMDNNKFTNINYYRADLGGVEIWKTNFPYAVGIYELHGISRPSRLTIQRMGRKLEEDSINSL